MVAAFQPAPRALFPEVTLPAPNYQMAGQAFLDLDMRATVLMFMDDRGAG
jgi:hypothetical protein